MAVIDVVTYNGEWELFEIRYNLLKDYVDEFRVVEFDTTFSGNDKSNYADLTADVFWDAIYHWPKVRYYPIEESQWSKYKDLALSSPNTKYGKDASHWVREFCQKESIKDCLTDLKDDDIVFIGDVDEIWDPEHMRYLETAKEPEKIKLLVYTYWLNNRSSEQFWGTLISPYVWIKNGVLNHLRVNAEKSKGTYGWHFTSLAPYLRQKLLDSYTEESYATPWVMNNLEGNIKQNKDFLGRDFTFKVDESDWPPWLAQHRQDYKHLLKLNNEEPKQ